MPQSASILVPTVITDKNGKITTVHKKQDASAALRAAFPTPVLAPVKKTSNAARVRTISRLFDDYGLQASKNQTTLFLKSCTPQQLDVVDEALEESKDCSPHELAVIQSAFYPLMPHSGRDTSTICETLALRSAFSTANLPDDYPRMDVLYEYVYGVRFTRTDDYDIELNYMDEKEKQENIALLRFSYQVNKHAPSGGFLPTYRWPISRGSSVQARVYDSHDLSDLIIESPERVDDLIEIALNNETCDGNRLRALLGHEGHSTLSNGAL